MTLDLRMDVLLCMEIMTMLNQQMFLGVDFIVNGYGCTVPFENKLYSNKSEGCTDSLFSQVLC